ncbi:hypothetical protein BS636_07920 [Acinetobacter sp. LoGeW2-3]|uniref:HAD hydrolase-like protein n=1 Tax=Acinetobacter sp. LoGeW2-3 TaxID=1808001 RepID=UPI000C0588D6|nr:HAD hydrolase-like protein [Acinetobacter sp. LoGeW2-3]ATO19586.1 hypothetical protein BS636_07920 [Acinetobacter sp. LoGeW2-3]
MAFLHNPPVPYQLVIFDVDGTLVDSFEQFIELLNHFAGKYRYALMHKDQVEHLRALPPRQIRRALNLSMFQTFRLMYDCKREMRRSGKTPELFDGIADLLHQLKQQGVRLAIVTSNTPNNCRKYLGSELLQLFDWVETNASIYGKAKQIRKIAQQSKLRPELVIYIGDQIIDVESAHRNGITVAAVTWGFNSESALIAHQPHYLIHTVQQLESLLLTVQSRLA